MKKEPPGKTGKRVEGVRHGVRQETKQGTVLAVYCRITNYPNTLHQKHIRYQIVSFHGSGIQAQCRWVLCFMVCHKVVIQVLAQGLQSYPRDQPEKDLPPHSLNGGWQHIAPYGTESLSSLLVVGQRLSSVPGHVCLSNKAACLTKHASWESKSK